MQTMQIKPITIFALPLLASFMFGCVQRTITISSDPEGALVYLNDQEVGRTPTTVPFTFYGTYDVRLVRAGYQTLTTSKQAKAPVEDLPVVDLITEAMPGTHRINLDWHFELSPLVDEPESDLIERARDLQTQLDSN